MFTHDCDDCVSLGTFWTDSQGFDLYLCGDKEFPSVIARYGDDGSEYISGIAFVGTHEPLTEAFRIALSRDLINVKRVSK